MYRSMKEWLNEIENFAIRAERVPPDAMPWIETAWRLAVESEREACATIADQAADHEDSVTLSDTSDDTARSAETAREIADAIRARSNT